jgi:hypothetical protein
VKDGSKGYDRAICLKILADTRQEYKTFLEDLETGMYDGLDGLAAERGAEYRATIAEYKKALKEATK